MFAIHKILLQPRDSVQIMSVIISQLNLIMNSKSRILPHLNICYLHKKAYDIHRKKIELIKNSLKSSLVRKLSNLTENYTLQQKVNRREQLNKMSTIKQQCTEPNILSRMRPINRRKYFEQVKQNQRLNKRIQTCASTINRKIIENHKIRSEQLKNRISKFKNDPNSHKSLLKSQRSLQLLQKLRIKQKYREIFNYHNQNSSQKVISEAAQTNKRSKSLIYKQLDKNVLQSKAQVAGLNKKSSFDRLMHISNTRRIQGHFQPENQKLKHGKNFRQKSMSFDFKQKIKTEVSQNFWKSRCFTTQLEHY